MERDEETVCRLCQIFTQARLPVASPAQKFPGQQSVSRVQLKPASAHAMSADLLRSMLCKVADADILFGANPSTPLPAQTLRGKTDGARLNAAMSSTVTRMDGLLYGARTLRPIRLKRNQKHTGHDPGPRRTGHLRRKPGDERQPERHLLFRAIPAILFDLIFDT